MTDYQILSGPHSLELRRQLDQMLLFSRFSPMLSFGRPTAGGHVVLSLQRRPRPRLIFTGMRNCKFLVVAAMLFASFLRVRARNSKETTRSASSSKP